MKAIKNEPKAIFKAFSKATQALNFILDLQEKKEVA
jgi:antirestriction protein ArdC